MREALAEVIRDALADPVFLGVAAVAIGAALMMVSRRNPVYGALWLMVCFLSIAIVFLKLSASFLAAIHVFVYTGAILVLFLFVIMLLNLQPHELGQEHSRRARAVAGLVCAVLAGLAAWTFLSGGDGAAPYTDPQAAAVKGQPVAWGGVEHVGQELFARFVVPFEIVSVLVVVAIFGAVVLAKRKLGTGGGGPEGA